MSDILKNNVTGPGMNKGEGARLESTTKMKLLNNSQIVVNGNVNKADQAVEVNTTATFVRTPDGVVHAKDGEGYTPIITSDSYVKKT